MKHLHVSVDDWVAEYVEESKGGNRSARVQELVIKGMMHEHDEKLKKQLEQAKKNMKVHA